MREYKWIRQGGKVWVDDWSDGPDTLNKVKAYISSLPWDIPSNNYTGIAVVADDDRVSKERNNLSHASLIKPRGFKSRLLWLIYNYKFSRSRRNLK